MNTAAQQALPSVTVVVPVYNRRAQMMRCLDALLAQDYPSFEVLVMDNGSTDGTLEACRERAVDADVPIRVEVMSEAQGHRRNAGARLARGEIVAYTDSDCMPSARWLRSAVAPFADASVGIVTGTTLPEHPPPYGNWYASQEITDQTWRFETCNALFRREALLASDGFDSSLIQWEDTAAGWSVMRAGWRAVFASDAVVYHDVTYPGFRWHVRRARSYGQGAAVVRRYPELRRRVLWAGLFQAPRNALVAVAALGLLLAVWRPRALALAAPYLWWRRPRGLARGHLRGSAQLVTLDMAQLEGMVRGSIKSRTLML